MQQYLIDVFISQYFRKTLFGKKYMFFKDYYPRLAMLLNHCLTLGYVYEDRIIHLMKIFTNPTMDASSAVDGISYMAKSIDTELSENPESFHQLFSQVAIAKLVNMFFKSEGYDYRDFDDFEKMQNKKIPIDIINSFTALMIYPFIGYGYRFPEKTEKLLTYMPNDELRDLAIASGLDIPKERNELQIIDFTNSVYEVIRPFVKANHPELMDILEL